MKEETIYHIPQRKMNRLFRMISLLHTGKYPIYALAEKLEMSERTIFRYITFLNDLGFVCAQNARGKYYLVDVPEWVKDLHMSPYPKNYLINQ